MLRSPAYSNHLSTNQQGSVIVEAAFVIPIFFLFIFGIIELGRLYWVRTSMQLAISEAGRHAMIHTEESNEAITSILESSIYSLDPDDFIVDITSENIGGINYKVINATYSYRFITHNLLSIDPITISYTSKFPILQ